MTKLQYFYRSKNDIERKKFMQACFAQKISKSEVETAIRKSMAGPRLRHVLSTITEIPDQELFHAQRATQLSFYEF